MNKTIIATYEVKPTHYTHFKNLLAEIQRYICPLAANSKLKIEQIESIFKNDDPEIAVGFKIHASKAPGGVKGDRSEGLLPSTDELGAVIDGARQNLVNSEKTLEGREQKIQELSAYAENTVINGKPHVPRRLIADDPRAPLPSASGTEVTDTITLFDIERGRFRVGARWVVIDSQIAEEFRDAFKKSGLATLGNHFDLEQTYALLDLLADTVKSARHLLDDPLYIAANE